MNFGSQSYGVNLGWLAVAIFTSAAAANTVAPLIPVGQPVTNIIGLSVFVFVFLFVMVGYYLYYNSSIKTV